MSESYVERASAYKKSGNLEAAIQDLDNALELDPGNSIAYADRGYIYRRNGRIEEALEHFTNAIKLKPDNAWYYMGRADVHAERGDIENQLLDLNRAISLDHLNRFAFSDRVNVYKKLEMWDKVISDYNTLRIISPDVFTEITNFVRFFEEFGDYSMALFF